MDTAAVDSTVLAVRFHRGEPEAVETVRLRVRRILGFSGYAIPRPDRRDLEQEIMTQLWRLATGPSFEPSAGFLGLVQVVTSRRTIDWLRRRREPSPAPLEAVATGDDPLSRVLRDERWQLASEAIARLDAPCRDLVRLHLAEGLGYRDLSEVFGKSEGALRVKMHRCIRQVRELLAELVGVREDVDSRSEES